MSKKNEEINSDLNSLCISDKKMKQFFNKKIYTLKDLLYFFPRDYKDYSKLIPIVEGKCCFIMKLCKVKSFTSKNNLFVVNASGYAMEQNTPITVTWFGTGAYQAEKIGRMINMKVLVAGEGKFNSYDGFYSVVSPDVFDTDIHASRKIHPVYSKIHGMSNDYLLSCLKDVLLNHIQLIQTNIPEELAQKWNLISLADAIRIKHQPPNMSALNAAKKRLLYEDLYYFADIMNNSKTEIKTDVIIRNMVIYRDIIHNLPYELTKDQTVAIESMKEQMLNSEHINALVQGDVGCGKSIIAFLMAALAIDNGYQAVIMAPTSVLAEQHYCDLVSIFEHYGIDVEYVKPLSGMRKKEKIEMLRRIASGESQILIGTHSLLSDEITYHNIGIIITDEEHKFGVEQREKLLEKTKHGAHYITMSATPIPRSLASIVYGENMQIHIIESMPPGRVPVQTAINNNWKVCMDFVKKQVNTGRQIYAVCPQVDANEKRPGIMSVKELYEEYCKYFPAEQIGCLTGKNSKKEMEMILENFKNNNIAILIATTVIEVGVNVPNANTIIIHNAEMFGLAPLHQLRGRVGRGGGKAYCILFSEKKNNPRLQVMVKTTNGFIIAEEDLKQRGTGDLIGTKQSGMNYYTDLIIQFPDEYQIIKNSFNQ